MLWFLWIFFTSLPFVSVAKWFNTTDARSPRLPLGAEAPILTPSDVEFSVLMEGCHCAGKQGIARGSCTGSTGPGCSLHHGQRGAGRPRPASQLRPGPVPGPTPGGCCTGGHLPPQVAACACPPACARPAQAAQGRESVCLLCIGVWSYLDKVLLLGAQLKGFPPSNTVIASCKCVTVVYRVELQIEALHTLQIPQCCVD